MKNFAPYLQRIALNDCLFDISYLTLAFEVAKINSEVDVVKILIYTYANYSSNEMARFFRIYQYNFTQG